MNFVISEQEQRLVKAILGKVDTDGFGVVTRDQAADAFIGSGLSPTTLDKIWQIADADHNEFLTEDELGAAIRLVSWAQKGMEPKEELLAQVCSPPILNRVPPSGTRFNPAPRPSHPMHPTMPVPVNLSTLQLTPADRLKYLRIFYRSGPIVNGLLDGNKAREYFLQSNLPTDVLDQIWHLADTHGRGSLDATDFVIGMFLIQSNIFNKLQTIPSSLPPGLYEQASGGIPHPSPGPRLPTQWTANSSGPQPNVEPTQNSTDHTAAFFSGRLSRSPETTVNLQPLTISQPLRAPTTSQSKWNVSAEEKARYDTIFEKLDSQRRGSIQGEIAAEYMRRSQLPLDTLSRIWDQVDQNRDGELEPDEFALAMHLMHKVLKGEEIRTESPKPLDLPKSSPDSDPESRSWSATATSSQGGPLQMPVPVPAQTVYMPTTPAPSVSHRVSSSTQNAEVTSLRNQILSAQRTVESMATDRSVIVASSEAAESELVQLQGQLAEVEELRKVEEEQLTTARGRKTQQDANLATMREELARIKYQVDVVQRERDQVNQELDDMITQVRAITDEVTKMKADVEKVVRETNFFNSSLDAAKEQLASGNIEKGKLRAQLDQAREEHDSEQELGTSARIDTLPGPPQTNALPVTHAASSSQIGFQTEVGSDKPTMSDGFQDLSSMEKCPPSPTAQPAPQRAQRHSKLALFLAVCLLSLAYFYFSCPTAACPPAWILG